MIESDKDFGLGQYDKGLHDEYAKRKRKRMVSRKKLKGLMDAEDRYDEDGEFRGRYYGIA